MCCTYIKGLFWGNPQREKLKYGRLFHNNKILKILKNLKGFHFFSVSTFLLNFQQNNIEVSLYLVCVLLILVLIDLLFWRNIGIIVTWGLFGLDLELRSMNWTILENFHNAEIYNITTILHKYWESCCSWWVPSLIIYWLLQ